MSKKKFENMAKEIYNLCKEYGLWTDTIIYFNGKAWTDFDNWDSTQGYKLKDGLYEYYDRNPLNYFEYANPETLSMSFEGGLYEVLNGYVLFKGFLDKFNGIFEKYGLYWEQGHAWNLSAYEV